MYNVTPFNVAHPVHLLYTYMMVQKNRTDFNAPPFRNHKQQSRKVLSKCSEINW